jgi:predicted O-linked N-acetylglucosamine transferase (SPINDLY family)
MFSSLFDNVLRSTRQRRAATEAAVALEAGNVAQALKLLETAHREAPNDAHVAMLLGQALIERDELGRGFELLDKAVRLAPDLPEARIAFARQLQLAGRIGLALEQLHAAARVAPDDPAVRRALLRPLAETCDWPAVAREREALMSRIRSAKPWTEYVSPMDALLLGLPAAARRAAAEARAADLERTERRTGGIGARRESRGAKLRIGYLSGDFRDHAVTHLAGNLFRLHDRNKVEVLAFSYGRDDVSAYRKRVMEGVDRFVDVRGQSHAEIARAIAGAGVDILVDLAGHAPGNRMGVLAHRPAPMQAHYLGYPGTTGARFVDYFIADAVVAPAALEAEFTERFVRLPDCFMISEPAVVPPPAKGARAEQGLPADAFVFVNFNQNSRIDEHVWAAWMAILKSVPGSVLWLKHANDLACANLRRAATAAGIDAARLVFAPDVADKPAHLARLALADLGLDTFGRYNGHTSTADALWAGVPVITTASDCFPGRVAASVLTAAGLADGVAPDVEAYRALAIACAQDGNRLAALRGALAEGRERAPFFKPERTVRALEQAYAAMWDRYNAGLEPETIIVA